MRSGPLVSGGGHAQAQHRGRALTDGALQAVTKNGERKGETDGRVLLVTTAIYLGSAHSQRHGRSRRLRASEEGTGRPQLAGRSRFGDAGPVPTITND
jgi:hypothetical protein